MTLCSALLQGHAVSVRAPSTTSGGTVVASPVGDVRFTHDGSRHMTFAEFLDALVFADAGHFQERTGSHIEATLPYDVC